MFRVFILIKQLVFFSFHTLQERFLGWINPRIAQQAWRIAELCPGARQEASLDSAIMKPGRNRCFDA